MLKIEGIQTYYGSTPSLFDVSLNVQQGQVVSLIGNNGAGKSTTLKTISGLIKPRKGKILFFGEEIQGLSPHVILRKGIAHSPEGRRVWPMMTVLENLEMGAYTRKSKTEIDKDLDRMFGFFPILEERRWQKAGSLSGGEQQMLVIARAMMARPKLLLLDEPSMGLAPTLVEQMGDIVRMLNKEESVSILMVEQNAKLALSVAQRVYVLETGRVVLKGSPKELRHNDYIKKAYFGG